MSGFYQYNVVTFCNDAYYPFLIPFLKSLFAHSNDSINAVYVYNTGLHLDNEREVLSRFNFSEPPINFLPSGICADDLLKIHGTQWQKIVYSKAELFKNVIRQKSMLGMRPTAMIDVDTLFIGDIFKFYDVLPKQHTWEISPCYRTFNLHICSHIGSFVMAKATDWVTEEFIPRWIDIMTTMEQTPKESPSLSRAVFDFKLGLHGGKILSVPEYLFSSVIGFPVLDDTCAIHMKSDGANFCSVEERMNHPQVEGYIRRYQ